MSYILGEMFGENLEEMSEAQVEVGVAFLTQTAAGILGNSCLLCFYSYTLLTGQKLLVNVYVPLRVIGPRHKQNVTLHMHYIYCSPGPSEPFATLLHVVLFIAIDVMCLVFMMWASSSMVLFLQRHKQRVWYIHSHIPSRRPDHEARATHTILTLVSMFISFYCLSAIFTLWLSLSRKPGLWLMDTCQFLGAGFSVLSPYVLISRDTRLIQVFYVCIK
ncbi:PREDICTED: vomeronasal type-1 receptor 1-like [Dipodomys ordii]|uniref:Vomeronasal type-1 receptor n=1 Tax=Dipodomys ordii TaxID=10020 RepID=A0A1S3G4A5_DIPOR|nr:PREDICTED: vomeronasal type-1 receptor 1-like [Dipodomys ordii]